ncbi:hypothetical protein SEUCBS140593_002809 [Sporothrix eucalyptigena]|uniref:Suppressor of anucleate metulae protein B n=1 Tax=Sporothrix eucalyptigena TaxID=1812306 RepID=A0ABP0B9L7_9PEZI
MATVTEDIEEYQTTFLTTSDYSATSIPALEVPPVGLVHENAILYTTVLDTMKQAVPIDVKASKVGTKKSGLFFVGEEPMSAGEMLFLTNPLVMARNTTDDGVAQKHAQKPNETLADSNICDYCFRGPQTFAERGANTKDNTSQVMPPARRCTGCNLLSFCNKTCHQKAWKQFHRFECGLLKSLQRRDPEFLLHLRLLLMDKANTIPDNVMKVIRDLNIPFPQPLHPSLEHNVKNCALHAYHLLSLKNRDFTFIRDVLCRILGNQAVISTADETAIVHCFDIALALLNHSCEPNAFIFVEGRQTRVRSIRTIQPGEEITVALVDTRLDVESRREALRHQTLNDNYVCNCDTCDQDASAMEDLADGKAGQMVLLRQFHANVIPKALQLMCEIKKAIWDKKKTDLIHDFVALAEGEFIAHFDKDPMLSVNYKPIPWLRMAGAAMFLEIRELESALYYAAMSFMFHERRFDHTAATDLRILVNTLRAICELAESDKQYKNLFTSHGSDFPELPDLKAFTVSCTFAFGLLAAKVYGPKIGFVRAVIRWGKEGETLCAPLKPCTPEFDTAAERAQRKLMAWCLGDRRAPFYPINAPTMEQYVQLTDILRARDQQLELADLAEQAGQAVTAEEYEHVEKVARAKRSERSEASTQSSQSAKSGKSQQSHVSGSSGSAGTSRPSGPSGSSGQSEQLRQSEQSRRSECSGRSGESSDQVDTVLRIYEEKMRAAKRAENLLKREKERRKQKSSRKEDANIENADLEHRLKAMFDAKIQEMFDQGINQPDRRLGDDFGHAQTARSSTVEEVCRLQADW